MNNSENPIPNEEYIYGAKEIAAALGLPERTVRHLVETKRLPVGKLGNKLFTKRSELTQYMDDLLPKPDRLH